MKKVSRRGLLGGFCAGAAASLALFDAGCAEGKKVEPPEAKKLRAFKNEEFYKEGKFDPDAAKEAYYEFMAYYSYPVVPRLKTEDFWVLDFALGNFMEVGMAGIFWINNLEDGYFGHDIWLLPGQMIPEHAHMKTAKAGPKMEGWHVRHGWVYVYGEGEPTPGVDERIPPLHRKIAVARTEKKLMPGECATLGGAEQKHWMLAGPEGAIVSEYATYHDMDGLRFTHPDIKL